MIELMFLYSIPQAILVLFQYVIGEQYLINYKRKKVLGYVVVVFCLIVSIIYAVYLLQFIEYMEALSVLQLIILSFLFRKFFERYKNNV